MDTFVVLGLPVPQGSMRHVGGGRIVSKSPALKEWRSKVADIIRQQVGEPAYPNAVRVNVIFNINKPKTVKRDLPTVPPDLDKLQRAIGDAISIDVKYLLDDSQIVEWTARKIYGSPAGVIIQVELL